MKINLLFWIFTATAILGTSLYYFGAKTNGYLSGLTKSIGGFLVVAILIISFFLLGWKTAVLLIISEFTIISFISAIIVESIYKTNFR